MLPNPIFGNSRNDTKYIRIIPNYRFKLYQIYTNHNYNQININILYQITKKEINTKSINIQILPNLYQY
jgi:hypothetical protein